MIKEGLPKYCNKCGKELVTSEVNQEYDIYTGEPVDILITLQCPEYVESFLGTRNNGHYKHVINVVNREVQGEAMF